MIGASSLFSIAAGIVRTKAIALFLGPAGVGLMALYVSIADVVQSLAGMGIQSSGVRQIAEAAGSRDAERVARTAAVVRRVAVVLGLLGGAVLMAFSDSISRLTFGSNERALAVALLSLVVLFREVSAGQAALIQGMRRISDLARTNVLSAFFGTLITIPLIYLWGEHGIVPSLAATAVVSVLIAAWYSRKAGIERMRITLRRLPQETASLLTLGFVFMASSVMTLLAAYIIRLMVMRKVGLDAAGLYQSAWALGGLYVMFILQSMGSDFYPRLTAAAKDDIACNRMVNEQAHVSVLLAGPGVIATLTFAPFVLGLFYSAEFSAAVDLLRWICLGMMLRVVAWPMGFIVVAKGAQQIFFWTEGAATLVHVGLAWFLITQFGLEGSGAAFFGLYAWHATLIYVIVRRLTGFRWTAANQNLGLLYLALAGGVFCSFFLLPSWLATTAGAAAVVVSAIHSLRTLLDLLPAESFPPALESWLLRRGWRAPRRLDPA